MQKWEYHILKARFHKEGWELHFRNATFTGTQQVEEYLNRLGEDGWELVSVFPNTMHGGGIFGGELFFKRRKE